MLGKMGNSRRNVAKYEQKNYSRELRSHEHCEANYLGRLEIIHFGNIVGTRSSRRRISRVDSCSSTPVVLVIRLISIGLYRDFWIAAIASSRTRLATLTGAMCKTSQCELRSLRVDSGMLNVIRIVTYYTLPPLESSTSSD